MSEALIAPLFKSPHPQGRVFASHAEWQDWYRGIKKAIAVSKKLKSSRFLLASNFSWIEKNGTTVKETDMYRDVLIKLGIGPERIDIVDEGVETLGQLAAIKRIGQERNASVHVVSTFLHYPRVRELTSQENVIHHVAWGLPRPREAVTDSILDILFILMPVVGKTVNKKIASQIVARRKEGKL